MVKILLVLLKALLYICRLKQIRSTKSPLTNIDYAIISVIGSVYSWCEWTMEFRVDKHDWHSVIQINSFSIQLCGANILGLSFLIEDGYLYQYLEGKHITSTFNIVKIFVKSTHLDSVYTFEFHIWYEPPVWTSHFCSVLHSTRNT